MNAWQRFKAIENYTPPFIVPIQSHQLYVYESNIDGDLLKDWIIARSPHLIGDEVVKSWAAHESGLDGWHIVPGYPVQLENEYEWRLRRVKDW